MRKVLIILFFVVSCVYSQTKILVCENIDISKGKTYNENTEFKTDHIYWFWIWQSVPGAETVNEVLIRKKDGKRFAETYPLDLSGSGLYNEYYLPNGSWQIVLYDLNNNLIAESDIFSINK